MSRPWAILLQEERVPFTKATRDVEVRHVRMFPGKDKETGELKWRKLKYILLRMYIEDAKGYELKLSLNATKGTLTIQHPDEERYEYFQVGTGKRKRMVPDVLKPKVAVPGKREHYDTLSEGMQRLAHIMGQVHAAYVIRAFASKLKAVLEGTE